MASLESDLCDSTHDVGQIKAFVSLLTPQVARKLSQHNPDLFPKIRKGLQTCFDATRDLHQLLTETMGNGQYLGSKRAKAVASLRLRRRKKRLNESQQQFKTARVRVSHMLQLVHL